MLVGLCTVELFIPDSGSLKGKRQVIKSIKDRIRQKFNVSIAEIGDQDLWQRVVFGIACVGTDKKFINGVLDKIIDLITEEHSVELLKHNIEFV
ncbi:MAG: DUF503 domain-containing protein [Nitrospirae bacterium]|nr:DUF503 domain-containing protein [Nitrospirota bacterium]